MKIKFLAYMAVLLLLTSSASQPALAQQAQTDSQSQYKIQKSIAIKYLKAFKHVMMSAPVTRDIIELADTLKQLSRIEQDYHNAKSAELGVATLDRLDSQYADQLARLTTLDRHLFESVHSSMHNANESLEAMLEWYDTPSKTPERAEVGALMDDLSNTVEPLDLSCKRAYELYQVVRESLQARQQADPTLVITDQMEFEEIRVVAPALLEKHSENRQ